MQLVSNCYTTVLYQPVSRVYLYKNQAVYLSDFIGLRFSSSSFWKIQELRNPTIVRRWFHMWLLFITKTRLFKYIENFTTKKGIFSDKNTDIFHIPAQNIDYGHSLEPPR